MTRAGIVAHPGEGRFVARPEVFHRGDVGGDAAAVIARERLGHDRPADPVGGGLRLLERIADLALRHRDAGIVEDLLGPFLVVGDRVADDARGVGHRRLEPPLLHAVAELGIARALGQVVGRDAAVARGLDDRAGRGAERVRVAHLLQVVDDGLKVDVLAVVELAGRCRPRPRPRPGPWPRRGSGRRRCRCPCRSYRRSCRSRPRSRQVLQLDGDVLDHVAGIGAVADPLQEAARLADRAAVIVDGGDQVLELLGDPRDLVARPVLQFLDVEPHVDGLVAAVIVRPAQRAVFKYMQSFAPGFRP